MVKVSVASQLEQIEINVMSGLKDFQKATVNRIDQLYRSGQMRVLVSDEVGLGKTLVARGTIAKLAKIQKEIGDNLVKIIYICSNTSIAEQNLNKLRISSELRTESTHSSRLSMQHLNIFMQENDPDTLDRYIQLIPLTPETSFRMTNGAGTYQERALMFAILKRLPELSNHIEALEFAMKDYAYSGWDLAKVFYEEKVIECDNVSSGRYLTYMKRRISEALSTSFSYEETCLSAVIGMCKRIEDSKYQKMNNNNIIGKLRVLFAKISLDKLEPDLVIMDEFQRFKYLINSNPESEMGMLSKKFFNSNKVRMLLLSATPYKMYSTLEEIDEYQVDEHYSEFFDVINFLKITEKEKIEFKLIWSNYSTHIKEFTQGKTTVLTAKEVAEEAIYQHICRTERISAVENADIIDDKDVSHFLNVSELDIKSYLQIQKLVKEIGATFSVPIDYIKSTPYLMSFMRNYQLKRYIESYFSEHPNEINKINDESFWIKKRTLDKYEKVPNYNAKLDRLMQYAFKDKADLLLWVPPSTPYYQPQGVFKNVIAFSKTLLFSTWEMVPRMIAGLLSYEAERKTIGKLAKANEEKELHYFNTGEKRYPSARLNFSVSNDTPNAMTLFCLLYPSQFLTNCYEPINCLNRGLSLSDIEKEIRDKISEKLEKYVSHSTGNQDKRWYYIAPLLLDEKEYVTNWLNSDEALTSFDKHDDEIHKRQKGFLTHLKALRELYISTNYDERCNLGKMPDDLLDVLTDIAISSPAVSINRTYLSYSNNKYSYPNYLPSQIAKIFINRMNTTESTATIELACGKKTDDAHWKNLLTYCKHGNIQSMFDEYAHLITNGLDSGSYLIDNLHYTIANSMNVRTTNYTIDTFNSFKARMNGKKERVTSVRSHFAVAFTKGDGKDKDADRKKSVRNSFNSPFRPFVLASTSIGQEGLDFHNYCRRIVHWNLPSNPVDLEQREGRINRFECLAIRQNIAKRYSNIEFESDVWKEMFEEAQRVENKGLGSDLIPFWGLTKKDDMHKIERIVPMYPFSKDGMVYERLIKILSLYRLTLGQARQEELLEYLFQNHSNIDEIKKHFINLSPYYRQLNKSK